MDTNHIYFKVLPMQYPQITCYPFHANLLSVVGNYQESIPWFYNYYIQLEVKRNYENGVRLDFYTTLLWKCCPWIYFQRLSRDFILRKWDSIIDFIIDSIDLGYYVYFIANYFYIPISKNYNQYHKVHDIFIFGYDKNTQMFDVADFFRDGIYEYAKVPFSCINIAYNSLSECSKQHDWLNGVELISFFKRSEYHNNKELDYRFDPALVKSFICDYITSSNTLEKYKIPTEKWKRNWVYGVEIYDFLIEYLEQLSSNKVPFDTRPFAVLNDHKKLMMMRIKFMGENSFLYNWKDLYQDYSNVLNRASILKGLWIKYSISSDKKLLNRMILIINEIKKIEIDVLTSLCNNICE
ncbi:hypothetical protein [Anaerocolumna sp. MB42-C2]|uniref:hypothetical protein n=1 Tax=Anaerocolumna sp. MB42-C2 TaxID=3070997 RepID=UPI0027DF3680|nr:hypothetical protein [Anaerocolumna sp. MB42-C2]WMJ86462.1 hypothetical protein RBU59_20840 [Anaerocolumna sp. MB42-C2]